MLEVGQFETLRGRYPHAPVIGSPHHLLMPGLINAHHHGYGFPGYNLGRIDDALELWVPDPLRRRALDHYLDTLYCDLRSLRAGVTTVLHQGYARGGLPVEEAHRAALNAHDDVRIRVGYAPAHQDQNPIVSGDVREPLATLPQQSARVLEDWITERPVEYREDEYFSLLKTLYRDYQGHERFRFLAGPEEPEWCTSRLRARVANAARELDIGIHIHVLESPCRENSGSNPVRSTTWPRWSNSICWVLLRGSTMRRVSMTMTCAGPPTTEPP